MLKAKTLPVIAAIFILASTVSCRLENKSGGYSPATAKNKILASWEKLRFGAFVHFNDNTFFGKEICKNTDPVLFNPAEINFDDMMKTFSEAGIRYAVLTTRHTSGFCLWDSRVTSFDVAASPFRIDVVKLFTDACIKYDIKPCFYYCLWGGKEWNPADWNPVIREELKNTTPKEIITRQLGELAENYGDISEFWLDMYCWCDTSLSTQEIYDLIKSKNRNTIVHFNQHVQDGSKITYFPTDILNGEESLPPAAGHNPERNVNEKTYYLPFEYEITSQRCDSISLGNGLMPGSVWFTYPGSHFYPVDSLYRYISESFARGGSNVLLSTAPDRSGSYRATDKDSLIKLGKLLYNRQ